MTATFPPVGALYAQALSTFRDEPALVDGDRVLSYAALAQRVAQAIAGFDAIGLRAGDRVGLALNMSADAIVLFLAAQIAGLATVELSPLLPWEQLVQRARLAAPAVVYYDPQDFAPDIAPAFAQLPGTAYSLATTQDPRDFPASSQEARTQALAHRASSAGAINFTSGSTGVPKAILLDASCASAQALILMATVNHPARPVTVLAMTHPTVVHMQLTPALMRGGTVVTLRALELASMLDAARAHRANLLFLPTRMLYALIDRADVASLNGQVELFYYGGESMTAQRLRDAIAACGPIFAQVYGSSEAATVAVLRPQDHDASRPERLASVGRAVIGARIEVWDDAGNALPPHTPGQLMLRAPTAMSGYLGLPQQTRETLLDGWVRSGDVGYLDEEGFVFLMDRSAYAFEIGGRKLYPRELESVLGAHPGVSAAVAMGLKDDAGDYRLYVAVQLRPGAVAATADLAELVRAAAGVLPERVLCMAALPLHATSRKVDRPALTRMFKAQDV